MADNIPKKSVSVPAGDPGNLQARASSVAGTLRQHERSVTDTGNLILPRGRADQSGDSASDFPAQYFPDSEREDTRIALKQKLLAGPDRPLGDAQLTDRDIDWYAKKEDVRRRIAFDGYFARLFDTKDINKLRLAQQIHPEYYAMREREIDRQAQIQKKIAMIKLRGPVDLDDLMFIYALQNGGITLRPVPLYNLDKPPTTEETASQYKKGMFNPSRWIKPGEEGMVPKFMGRGLLGNDGKVASTASANGYGLTPDSMFPGPSQDWELNPSGIARANFFGGQ